MFIVGNIYSHLFIGFQFLQDWEKGQREGEGEGVKGYLQLCTLTLILQFHSAVVSGMAYIIDIVVIEIDLNGITSEGHKHSH